MAREFDEERMIRFLLRETSEEERQDIAEQTVKDEEFFLELQAVEDELISSYVRDELSPGRRERFEKHFLATPEQRQRMEFSRTLLNYLGKQDQNEIKSAPAALLGVFQRPIPAVVFTALFLLVLMGAMWATWDAYRSRTNLRQLQAEQEDLKRTNLQLQKELAVQRTLNTQLSQPQNSASVPVPDRGQKPGPAHTFPVLVVSLTPGQMRDLNSSPKLVISPVAELLRFRLLLDRVDESRFHRLLIKTADEDEILRQRIPNRPHTASFQPIVIDLSAKLFPPGDYLITLQGTMDGSVFTDVADYIFRVRDK